MPTSQPTTVPVPRVKRGEAITAERYNRLVDRIGEEGIPPVSARPAARRAPSQLGVETTARVFFVS